LCDKNYLICLKTNNNAMADGGLWHGDRDTDGGLVPGLGGTIYKKSIIF
jgi:hypothetical protein